MLNTVDKRIATMVEKIAGDKLAVVIAHAETLILLSGKSPGRALADSLKEFKLV